ncbi:MAG: IPT/TIG domain-containing protein [Bdellovibrionota bacterium]
MSLRQPKPGWIGAGLSLLLALSCSGGGLNRDGSQVSSGGVTLGPQITGVSVSPATPPCANRTSPYPYGLTSGGQTITVTGANFQAGAQVRLSKLLAQVTTSSDTQISATMPIGSPGPAEVVVINPDGQVKSFPQALILCPDALATAATAQVIPALTRIEVGQQLDVELQVSPGTQDDLRDLRPEITLDTGTASLLSGPSPGGADLLIGESPAIFRFVFLPTQEGPLVFSGEVTGVNASLDTPVTIGPVLSATIQVEPLLVSIVPERESAGEGQILRVFVHVANAGALPVTALTPEGLDADDEGGPLLPDPLPTLTGDATLQLDLVTAEIESGSGSCASALPPYPPLPTCTLDSDSIALFTFIYTATGPGTITVLANASGNTAAAPPFDVVRGLAKATTVLLINPAP